MRPLPRLMVAPNGARLGKSDHPAIPLTLDEIIKTAMDCHAAGADGLHLHLRDKEGMHILDAGLYREALAEIQTAVPGLAVQITTEAVGKYSSEHQRHVALESGANLVSTSIRELMSGATKKEIRRFFDTANDAAISVQTILYDLSDLEVLRDVLPDQFFNSPRLQVLFVLGRYSVNRDSSPSDLLPFLRWKDANDWPADWAVCAFGKGEGACLQATHDAGGKLRVGFENSLWSADGQIAKDNAQRVRETAALQRSLNTV